MTHRPDNKDCHLNWRDDGTIVSPACTCKPSAMNRIERTWMEIAEELRTQLAERDKELEQVKAALKEISECRDQTLLGCSEYDDSDDWNAGSHTVERAHQLGAYRAFNQCASIADEALQPTGSNKE